MTFDELMTFAREANAESFDEAAFAEDLKPLTRNQLEELRFALDDTAAGFEFTADELASVGDVESVALNDRKTYAVRGLEIVVIERMNELYVEEQI